MVIIICSTFKNIDFSFVLSARQLARYFYDFATFTFHFVLSNIVLHEPSAGARISPLTQSYINDRNIRFIRLFIVAYLGDRDRELAIFFFVLRTQKGNLHPFARRN